MTQPDLIVPLAGGVDAWIYAKEVEITRQGTKPIPGMDAVTDKWRISMPIRACLAKDGADLLDPSGREIPTEVPAGSAKCSGCDIADIITDPEVQQAIGAIRSVAMRLMAGNLVPTPPVEAP